MSDLEGDRSGQKFLSVDFRNPETRLYEPEPIVIHEIVNSLPFCYLIWDEQEGIDENTRIFKLRRHTGDS